MQQLHNRDGGFSAWPIPSLAQLLVMLGRALRNASYPQFWMFLLGGGVGWAAGLIVTAMSRLTQLLHSLLFQLPPGERLSSQESFTSPWLIGVPVVGGAVVVLLGLAMRRFIHRPVVDPIEANALHGGQMSWRESLLVAAQTMASSGFGASVGLEAGYTQAASVVGSKLAESLSLRRADMRLLVACGAAGAISAAFDAPLAGAFYAFETILGVYNVSVVAPVLASALSASFAARLFGAVQMPLLLGSIRPITSLADMLPYLFLGALAAGLSIAIMRSVIFCETLFTQTRCPAWTRPMLGGLLVGLLGWVTPHVLSSGHGALHMDMNEAASWQAMAFLFLLKALASAISLGSGFRGGLFFASLYLGLLFGRSMALLLASFGLLGNLSPELFAVVGMASMAVGIVGGPMTMGFLIMESTYDLSATGAVLAAAIVTSLVVRSTFGYSFSTWRLHLRGENLTGAHDVGRMRSLTVARLMRSNVQTMPENLSLADFRARFPLGSGQRVALVDGEGRYAGLMLVTDAYAPGLEDASLPIATLAKQKDIVLLPAMSANEAAKIFAAANAEELIVLQDAWSRKIIGVLTEQHVLRRYAEEMDKAHRDLTGLNHIV